MQVRKAFVALAIVCAFSLPMMATADGQSKAQVCVACHGMDGNSSNPVWPHLAAQNPGYIVAQLEAFRAGKRTNPAMAPMMIPEAEADMREVAAFFAAQTLRVAPVKADDIAAGQRLYRAGDAARGIPACIACHGPSGAGNPGSSYPALRGQHADYTIAQLKNYRDGTRQTDPQAMMRTIASRLSDADIAALAHFVAGLH
jgi:cytochrome c553